LKQINFIPGGSLAARGPGQLSPLPPFNPAPLVMLRQIVKVEVYVRKVI